MFIKKQFLCTLLIGGALSTASSWASFSHEEEGQLRHSSSYQIETVQRIDTHFKKTGEKLKEDEQYIKRKLGRSPFNRKRRSYKALQEKNKKDFVEHYGGQKEFFLQRIKDAGLNSALQKRVRHSLKQELKNWKYKEYLHAFKEAYVVYHSQQFSVAKRQCEEFESYRPVLKATLSGEGSLSEESAEEICKKFSDTIKPVRSLYQSLKEAKRRFIRSQFILDHSLDSWLEKAQQEQERLNHRGGWWKRVKGLLS